MTARKLRILHVVVQPVLVYDDGEELHPGPQTQPTTVPITGLADLAEVIRSEVAAFARKEESAGAHPDEADT